MRRDPVAAGLGANRRIAAAISVVLVVAVGCSPPARTSAEIPERIIAVAPSLVEILFELGLDDRVVGVGSFSRWPPEAAEKPRIGGLLDPRLETVVSLQPDLAVLLPSESALGRALEELGVEVMVLPVETVGDVVSAIEAIGERTGSRDRARVLVREIRDGMARGTHGAGLDVLLVVGRQPGNLADIYAAAPGTFLDELLARLGAGNAFADSPVLYPNVGLEAILSRSPDMIIELQPERLSEELRERLVGDWLGVTRLSPACVAVIDGDYTLLPGPRLPRLHRELSEALSGCGGADE